jgi:hypothetical protein
MKKLFLRVLSGVAGLIASLVAILGPFSVYSSQSMERESAQQYHGQPDFWGAVGGWLTVLFISVLLGFVAYFLLRFSLTQPKSKRPDAPGVRNNAG